MSSHELSETREDHEALGIIQGLASAVVEAPLGVLNGFGRGGGGVSGSVIGVSGPGSRVPGPKGQRDFGLKVGLGPGQSPVSLKALCRNYNSCVGSKGWGIRVFGSRFFQGAGCLRPLSHAACSRRQGDLSARVRSQTRSLGGEWDDESRGMMQA